MKRIVCTAVLFGFLSRSGPGLRRSRIFGFAVSGDLYVRFRCGGRLGPETVPIPFRPVQTREGAVFRKKLLSDHTHIRILELPLSDIQTHASSYVDPNGFVFLHEDKIYRGIHRENANFYRSLFEQGTVRDLGAHPQPCGFAADAAFDSRSGLSLCHRAPQNRAAHLLCGVDAFHA